MKKSESYEHIRKRFQFLLIWHKIPTSPKQSKYAIRKTISTNWLVSIIKFKGIWDYLSHKKEKKDSKWVPWNLAYEYLEILEYEYVYEWNLIEMFLYLTIILKIYIMLSIASCMVKRTFSKLSKIF